jgi:hypothetical protein
MLAGDHLLLKASGRYGTMFMNMRVVITVAMAILLRDFSPYGLLMTKCVY